MCSSSSVSSDTQKGIYGTSEDSHSHSVASRTSRRNSLATGHHQNTERTSQSSERRGLESPASILVQNLKRHAS